MATNANLPAGAFITSLGGKRCTAIPKATPAPAQPADAQPAQPTDAQPAAPAATEAESPEEPAAVPPPPPPPEEAAPAPSATSPPPPGETADGVAAVDATAPPEPSTTDDTTIQDVASEETTPAETSPSESASDSATPTSTAGDPTETATENDFDAITGDSTVQETPTAGGNAAVSMSMGTPSTSATTQESTGIESPSNSVEAEGASGPSSPSTQTTAAVVGGVVGGVAIISLIVFLIFFLRRRSKRKRRSTMLTSMFGEPGYGSRGEKEGAAAYTVSRTSLGPTPVSEKVKNNFVYGMKRIRGRFSQLIHGGPSPTVDLDRGTSQFGPPSSAASQSRSSSRASGHDDAPTFTERYFGWWGRKKRSGPPKSARSGNDPFTTARAVGKPANSSERAAAPNTQPDFRTLLKMDEEAARKSAAAAAGPGGKPRHPSSTVTGKDHFLSNLDFDFAGPFSDAHAVKRDSGGSSNDGSSVRHDSATIPPLALARTTDDSDPFADVHAVVGVVGGGPVTYVENLRRSRSRSASTGMGGDNGLRVTRIASSQYAQRESGLSVGSIDMYKRNTKFRSDPFDLDRPELLSGSRAGSRASDASSSAPPPRPPPRAAGRGAPATSKPRESYASWSSRYSGYSEDDGHASAAPPARYDGWGDPGPDVGPAKTGGDKKRASGGSMGSMGSVGKAM